MFNLALKFTPANVSCLKTALRRRFAQVKSSHLDEAIAASFGFNSHAAMRPVLHDVSRYARLVVEMDHLLLVLRLEQLGYHDIPSGDLRRVIGEIKFPQSQHDDEQAKAIQERRRPLAANV